MNRSSQSLTFAKAIDGYEKFKIAEGLSFRTIDAYKHYFQQWLDHNEDCPLKDITAEDLREFLSWYRTTYIPKRLNHSTTSLSPKTVRNAWVAFKSLFRWASDEFGYKNITEKVKGPKFQKKEVTAFTKEELESMLRACQNTKESKSSNRRNFTMQRPTATRDKAILLCLLDTGLRASELCSLQVSNLDQTTGKLTIKHGIEGGAKGGSGRVVFVGKQTRKNLWKYLNDRNDLKQTDPLFISQNETPFTKDSLRILVKRIAKRAGVSDSYPHKFRHTFAITYLRSGGDVFTLQKLLGHGSLDMVRHYANVAELDIEQAHRKASPVDNLHL